MTNLEEIFEMQRALNEAVFEKLRKSKVERVAAPKCIPKSAGFDGEPDSVRAEWWRNYILALAQEAAEAQESLPWKWWSSDTEITSAMLHNAKVELIDMLHFWVSACLVVGLDPSQVMSVYKQKHAVNLDRQAQGYRMGTKTEEDNLGLDTGEP